MRRNLIFKQMYYDTLPIRDESTYEFFKESNIKSESVAELSEEQSIEWVFRTPNFRKFFIEEFVANPAECIVKTNISEPITVRNKKPGDIDLMLVEKSRPDLAVAFEVKRVKIVAYEDGSHNINNVNSITKGVIQVNGYQSIGFYKSFLMIVLLDDCRYEDYANTMLRNRKSDSIEAIYDIPFNEEINEDVGIVFLKITQPTGKEYSKMAGIGFCIDKSAKELQQREDLTNKIREMIKVSS